MRTTIEQLEKIKGIDLAFFVSGKSFSAFNSGGEVFCAAHPTTAAGLLEIVNFVCDKDFFIIGGGSNVLIADKGYPGILISTRSLKGIDRVDNRLYVGAGELLPRIAYYALDCGLSGMEELSGIPGTLGGAVKNNAGAFNREIASVIENVVAVSLYSGEIVTKSAEEMEFTYRGSVVKSEGLLVVGATLLLEYEDEEIIAQKIKLSKEKRKKSQPSEISLGSTFKRVNGISAGYYIEKAGLKGARAGGAQVSVKHAGFIINTGGATSDDYIKLADLIKNRVYKEFNIELKEEIEYLDGYNGKNIW